MTIFWDIPKWNRGQIKWDGGSIIFENGALHFNQVYFLCLGSKRLMRLSVLEAFPNIEVHFTFKLFL